MVAEARGVRAEGDDRALDVAAGVLDAIAREVLLRDGEAGARIGPLGMAAGPNLRPSRDRGGAGGAV